MDSDRYKKAKEDLRASREEKKKGRAEASRKAKGQPQKLSEPSPTFEIEDPHPWVTLTRKYFEKASPSKEDGLLRPEQVRRLDLCVSPALLPRALLVFDRLLKALDSRKIPVKMGSGGTARTYAIVEGEEIEIRLKETCVNKPREPTEAEKARIRASPIFHGVRLNELRRTGTLSFILNPGFSERRQRDEPGRPLEGRPDTVIKLMLKIISDRRAREADRARFAIMEEERRQQRAEEERERGLEQARIVRFNRQLTAWEEARRIRSFAAEIREEAQRCSILIEPGSRLVLWLEWMERRAASFDPIPDLLAPGSESSSLGTTSSNRR